MKSLTDLNTYSRTSAVELTDPRKATVVFDRTNKQDTVDQRIQNATTTISVEPGTEITEVRNYSTADVRYEVTIYGITGSSISWSSVPSPMSLSVSGNTYTISGIRSSFDWEEIRAFDWLLPSDFSNYQPWYLTVKVIYFDEELGREVEPDWYVYVPEYFFLSLMESQFTSNVVGTGVRGTSVDMEAVFEFISEIAALFVTTEMVTVPTYLKLFNADFQSQMDVDFVSSVLYSGKANLNANSAASVTEEYIPLMTYGSYEFLSNKPNQLFATDTPPQLTIPDDTSNFRIEMEVDIGDLGTSSYILGKTFNIGPGDKASVNNQLNNTAAHYHPEYGQTTDPTFRFRVYYWESSQLIREFIIPLTYVGVGIIADELVEFNTPGTDSWSSTDVQRRYGKFDYLVVGAGAGRYWYKDSNYSNSVYGEAGGGAGEVILSNSSIDVPNSVSVTVGDPGPYTSDWTITAGELSNIDTGSMNVTAQGGPAHTAGDRAGSSGGGNLGGYNIWDSPSTSTNRLYAGGGGGGAGGPGGDATYVYFTPPGGTFGEYVGIGGDAGPGITINLGIHTFTDLATGGIGKGGSMDSQPSVHEDAPAQDGTGQKYTSGSERQPGTVKLLVTPK